MSGEGRALVWFRRDLRSTDHAALSRALDVADRVGCVFVFDTTILEPLLQRKRQARPGEDAALGRRNGARPALVGCFQVLDDGRQESRGFAARHHAMVEGQAERQ